MLRKLHAWPALAAGLLVVFMALTGAVLSLQPVFASFSAPANGVAASSDLATLAAGVASHIAGVEHLVRRANGELIAYSMGASGPAADIVDAVGNSLGAYRPSAFFQFVTDLHRAFLGGDAGRMVAALAAATLIVLSLGGVVLLVKRLGGWRRLFAPAKGTLSQRFHVELSRIGALLLTVLSATGLWMALTYFGVVGAADTGFSFPPQSNGSTIMATADMPALAGVALNDLRELVFPVAGDAGDVFTVITASGSGYVDQTNGQWLDFTPNTVWENVYQLVYTLHTGQGVWWYALLLGAGALSVPALFVTGLFMWVQRRRAGVRIRNNARPQAADTIILVGSEGNTTWGFAATLHKALTENGHVVHVGPMNGIQKSYRSAERLIVMASSYGNGDAPASARHFLIRLAGFEPRPGLGVAVLGFGDRSFVDFCGYAKRLETAVAKKGLVPLVAFTAIDRQSAQSFAEWGLALGRALGEDLVLRHRIDLPKTKRYVLESRRDFGQPDQAPRAILRFRPVGRSGFGSGFEAGDLIGIVPPGNAVPRYYSLASAARDGFIEICVSKQPGGLCSGFLCNMEPGTEIDGFIKTNPAFRAPRGKSPLILIGAGTGIAPFVGHLRANRRHRQAYLYWGGRDPGSDFLFREELLDFRKDGRLSGARIAFSRTGTRRYVQDELRDDGAFLRDCVAKGASILICGGAGMARGVTTTLDDVLAPLKLTSAALKQAGRLAEDVY